MYRLRCGVALAFVLLCYFSDVARALVQGGVCVFLCLATPGLLRSLRRESSTQTDEEAKEATHKETKTDSSGDLPDGGSTAPAEPLGPSTQYPHVRKSLQQAFESAYAQLLLPWYRVPEPSERQPLHRVLSRESDFVIERVIERAGHFDVYQVVVGSIRVLTQHLHNAKQPTRELPLGSREKEIAVLRDFSDVLVRNLFSSSLWGQGVTRCVLRELLAVKGLGLLVTWLSDPDTLNQLVVSQLGSVTPKGSAEDLSGSGRERASLVPPESKGDGEGSEGSLQEETRTEIKGKSRGQKLREKLSKLKEKIRIKKKKPKARQEGPELLTTDCMSDEEGVRFREGSVHSQEDSDRDSDPESHLASLEDMMEFKLSYKMWCVGQWAVSIPHAEWEDEDLILGVHLAETDSPETLQWSLRKSYMDVVRFRNRLQRPVEDELQDARLPALIELEDSEADDEVKESARASVQRFLQGVVSDSEICNTEAVFKFLCPLKILLNEEEDGGGVWGLLSGLANFLAPGQDEDENSSPRTEAPQEITGQSPLPPPPALPSENHDASAEKGSDGAGAALPAITVSRCDPPSVFEGEAGKAAKPAVESDSKNSENCPQEKLEDADNSLTINSAMPKERSLSQESLVSRSSSNEDLLETDHFQKRAAGKEPTFKLNAKENKRDKWKFGGANKAKGEGKAKGEDSPHQKAHGGGEHQEAARAVFDLLKEISGNSIAFNLFDAILTPFMPIVKMKVNSFLNKLNPTEQQVAAYIDRLQGGAGPESPPAPAPRTDGDKDETRARAQGLLGTKCLGLLILKKADVETVFKLFQKTEENKTLVFVGAPVVPVGRAVSW
ncbi:uncharacterized protein si:rp71-46j2.7 isoform X2 [Betta splendens]|uniref:Uncharacterized protein si:rp71-46j2.7 isoform X2 n=1 Tax=Betta splendens TaxID=158456 RepID=A0A9W2Y3E1_BETSP|nr:uncharacterized protein si:rp71-46j2.7 isoform X2 [Betta splendens]